jgi:hypothetical protein
MRVRKSYTVWKVFVKGDENSLKIWYENVHEYHFMIICNILHVWYRPSTWDCKLISNFIVFSDNHHYLHEIKTNVCFSFVWLFVLFCFLFLVCFVSVYAPIPSTAIFFVNDEYLNTYLLMLRYNSVKFNYDWYNYPRETMYW